MAARKRAALERMGSLVERHRVAEVDALRDDGPASLAALDRGSWTPARGWRSSPRGCSAICPRDAVDGIWRRFARALSGVRDRPLRLRSAPRRRADRPRAVRSALLLSAFVRGQRAPALRGRARRRRRRCAAAGFASARAAPRGASSRRSGPRTRERRLRIYLRHQPGDLRPRSVQRSRAARGRTPRARRCGCSSGATAPSSTGGWC